jgi:hypothetical protein
MGKKMGKSTTKMGKKMGKSQTRVFPGILVKAFICIGFSGLQRAPSTKGALSSTA